MSTQGMRRSIFHVGASIASTAILASATATSPGTFVSDPLPLTEDIYRLLRCSVALFSVDTSSKLQVLQCGCSWDWLDANGAQIASATLPVTQPWTANNGIFPASANAGFRTVAIRGPGDLYAALNLDFGIGAPAAIRVKGFFTIVNTDAGAPHSYTASLGALIERHPAGSLFG